MEVNGNQRHLLSYWETDTNYCKSNFSLFHFTLAIGLLYVKASVWQMLRGSIIIFTGLLSVSI